ncbi:MAG: AraC family transcriptional regulator [Halieaceae bacterium]|nr:AraC family transcriptional regulator [Halieaceae bacterium]
MSEYMQSFNARALIYLLVDRKGEGAASKLLQSSCEITVIDVLTSPVIETQKMHRLLDLCVSRRGLGYPPMLEFACNATEHSLGHVGSIVVSSRTIRSALAAFQAFSAIVLPGLKMTARVEASGNMILSFNPAGIEGDLRDIYLFGNAAVAHSVMHALTGREQNGAIISIPCSRPDNWSSFNSSFTRNVKFVPRESAGHLEVPARLLDRHCVAGDPEAHAMAMRRIEPWLQMASHEKAYSELVCRHLTMAIPANLNLAAVAKLMSTTERTLRRRLEREDTSFQRLKDTTMVEIAINLAAASVDQSAAAKRLGKESHHFGKWFKDKTGYKYGDPPGSQQEVKPLN